MQIADGRGGEVGRGICSQGKCQPGFWDSSLQASRYCSLLAGAAEERAQQRSFILAHVKLNKGDMAQTHTHTQGVVYGHM